MLTVPVLAVPYFEVLLFLLVTLSHREAMRVMLVINGHTRLVMDSLHFTALNTPMLLLLPVATLLGRAALALVAWVVGILQLP